MAAICTHPSSTIIKKNSRDQLKNTLSRNKKSKTRALAKINY